MSSKYLTPNTTASYTHTTRTVTGATMLPAGFDVDDQTYGRQVILRIGTTIYQARVQKYISTSSVQLLASSGLPVASGTIDSLEVIDQGTRRVRGDYLVKLGLNLGSDESKLSATHRDSALDRAVAAYSKDAPHTVKVRVAGAAVATYNLATALGSLYVPGQTDITDVEYPSGESPRSALDLDQWDIYDDGTAQDGSNIVLRFLNDTPSAAEYFVLLIDTRMSLPAVGNPSFPDTDQNFENIANLATSYAFEMLAAAFAHTTNSTLSADAVDYGSITDRYLRLAKIFRNRYNLAVFGNENPASSVVAASVEREVKVLPLHSTERVFH